MRIPLHDVALATGVPLDDSGIVTGWSVDSRTVEPGDLFFALRGPHHDAHDHVAAAFRKGAIAAVVEREIDAPGPFIRVADTLTALQQVASFARRRWGGEVIGITGSAGKTTTKDAVAAMLSVRFPTGKTTGNFNNHVGVPVSLLRLPDDATHAVIEIGMNHAGEIRELSKIAEPRVGVVTNAGTAHIENFDSIEGIAAAKRELVEALPPGGIAVLNADDPRVAAMASAHRGNVVTFGLSAGAEIQAQEIQFGTNETRFSVSGTAFETRLSGRHGVLNLLAGIAVASIYGIPAGDLVEPVRDFEPGNMRGRRFERGGILIIDDCYNANPDAVRASLDVLRDTPAGRRIAVLGEMLELGRWAEALHREVGNYVAKSGINVLVGIRGVARQMVDAAIDGGLAKDAAFFFDEPEPAGIHLRTLAHPGDAILFKGSRGTHVEKALEKFLE
jgi:UDP-N-acetylmuramoyl-tripeptide--D-alanyl-D-alanine ligase